MNLYWWNKNNFGDWLGPYIFEYFNIKYKYSQLIYADIIIVGSILHWSINSYKFLFRRKKLVVLGSGCMFPFKFSLLNRINLRTLDIKLLRGPLSLNIFNGRISNNIPYGDPGLLVGLFFQQTTKKKYSYGLIPHYSQYDEFSKVLLPLDWVLIDPRTTDCLKVLEDISECDVIISQSLHGLIVADSLCIPNIWLCHDKLHDGGNFKFYDYFLSVDRPINSALAISSISIECIFDLEKIENNKFSINKDTLKKRQQIIIKAFQDYFNSVDIYFPANLNV